jgi:protein-L-isoaspartate(D-aspartate) O-methyltransferase
MATQVVALTASAIAMLACRSSEPASNQASAKPTRSVESPHETGSAQPDDPYLETRFDMVKRTISARGVTDPLVLTAMRMTPRHAFVPPAIRHEAYSDRALPIGFGLTISQPYIVAAMTEAARVKPGDKVLEIGTGSGYQAAVLAMMGARVYTIEIHEQLAARSALVLEQAGFRQVKTKVGDGWYGWSDAAPFDAIIVTCATPMIPDRLLAQLKVGGRVVAPIGDIEQQLEVIEKSADGISRDAFMDVRFGPMLGAVEREQ